MRRGSVVDVGVDHGGLDVAVAKEGLDSPDVSSVFEQVGCEVMAECLGRHALGDAGSGARSTDRSLGHGFVEVMAVAQGLT